MVEPRFGRREQSDLLALVQGDVLHLAGASEPPPGQAWPPTRWAAMINPADKEAVRRSIKCGSGYTDRKFALVGSQVRIVLAWER